MTVLDTVDFLDLHPSGSWEHFFFGLILSDFAVPQAGHGHLSAGCHIFPSESWAQCSSTYAAYAAYACEIYGRCSRIFVTYDSTLWYTNSLLWKITIFNGKIHYFYGHFQ